MAKKGREGGWGVLNYFFNDVQMFLCNINIFFMLLYVNNAENKIVSMAPNTEYIDYIYYSMVITISNLAGFSRQLL